MVKDLVCGMGVEENDSLTFLRTFEGKTYYFCSPECMTLFIRNPHEYINPERKESTMVKDLVCGMEVDEDNPPFTAVYKGKTYCFCSNSCKREFERDPEQFLKKSSR